MPITIPFVHRENPQAQAGWLDALRSAMPDYKLCDLADLSVNERASIDVAIVADPDPSDLATLPNLKWVHSLWAGVERMVAERPDNDLAIVRLIDPRMAESMSEAVLAWTLYLHRDMPHYRQQQDRKLWESHQLPLPSERTIGILGLGALGQRCAIRLKDNGFNTVGWNRTGRMLEGIETFSGPDGLTEMLAHTNVLVVLLPLTVETRGLLDTHRLSQLPAGASLINFARGPIIDDKALLTHLDTGHLAHAVLDVFDQEPLPTDNPFWTHPSVTVLPHISGPTNRTTASAIVATNIEAYVTNGTIPPSVDRKTGY